VKIVKGTGAAGSVATHVIIDSGTTSVSNFPSTYDVSDRATRLMGIADFAQYTLANDFDGSGNPIYVGRAAPGSSKASAVWQIRKLTYSGTNPTDYQYANGSTAFNAVWDNRAALSYS